MEGYLLNKSKKCKLHNICIIPFYFLKLKWICVSIYISINVLKVIIYAENGLKGLHQVFKQGKKKITCLLVLYTTSHMGHLINFYHSTMVLNVVKVCGVQQNKTKDLYLMVITVQTFVTISIACSHLCLLWQRSHKNCRAF